MRQQIDLELIPGEFVRIHWVREPRARRLRLSVSERGARLSVPPRASERSAVEFLREQRDWLRSQIARLPREGDSDRLQIGVSRALPLRGKQVMLRWREARFTRIEIAFDGGIEAASPAGASVDTVARALSDFYSAQARVDVGRWLPKYLPGLPRSPSGFRFSPLRSLWGSLSANAKVSLDLALILGPPAAFEYVLVHELCHLLHPDHSPEFWSAVERRFPNWRAQRSFLRAHGPVMKAQLNRLLEVRSTST